MGNWQHHFYFKESKILQEVTDDYGEVVLDHYGRPMKKMFIVGRLYLILHSKKYKAKIIYTVNRPNRSKKVPFFTDQRNKKQYFENGMVERLTKMFGLDEAIKIVQEALEQL